MREDSTWNHRHQGWHDLLTFSWYLLRSLFFVVLGGMLLAVSYLFFFSASSPLNVIVGVPAFSTGVGFVLLGPLDLVSLFTSSKIRRGVCLFCPPMSLKDFFVPQSLDNH
jgi:hypothetical protein